MPGIDIMQIRGNSALVYTEPLFQSMKSKCAFRSRNLSDKRKGAYSGSVTAGVRKRMARAITLMCQGSKGKFIFNPVNCRYQYHRLSFITLTISCEKTIPAREAYRNLLSPFLQWIRRMQNVKTYVWKAELQQRGQVHYHITCPEFIDYRAIRSTWNRLQMNAGYLKQFAEKFGHSDPNSTDVHEVRTIKKIDAYLIKELSKNQDANKVKARSIIESLIKAGEIALEDKDKMIESYVGDEAKLNGKVWDCSDNLTGKKYFDVELKRIHEDRLREWERDGLIRRKTGDFWETIFFDGVDPPDILDDRERKNFDSYIDTICNPAADPVTDIPIECVAQDIDLTVTYTVEQLKLFLN